MTKIIELKAKTMKLQQGARHESAYLTEGGAMREHNVTASLVLKCVQLVYDWRQTRLDFEELIFGLDDNFVVEELRTTDFMDEFLETRQKELTWDLQNVYNELDTGLYRIVQYLINESILDVEWDPTLELEFSLARIHLANVEAALITHCSVALCVLQVLYGSEK